MIRKYNRIMREVRCNIFFECLRKGVFRFDSIYITGRSKEGQGAYPNRRKLVTSRHYSFMINRFLSTASF